MSDEKLEQDHTGWLADDSPLKAIVEIEGNVIRRRKDAPKMTPAPSFTHEFPNRELCFASCSRIASINSSPLGNC